MHVTAPVRIAHEYTQHLAGPVASVFPLLCPVRETEWIEGWDPSLVISASGVAEQGCIFLTGADADTSVWTVTTYAPPHHIEFVKVTPGSTVAHISIRLQPDGDARCTALVRYEYTALSEQGSGVVADFTQSHYAGFKHEWETRLNHYLTTGTMLRDTTD